MNKERSFSVTSKIPEPLSKLYKMNILGGSKILCQMAVDGTEKGMRNAAQALSRIGITQDPSIAFPGNRV